MPVIAAQSAKIGKRTLTAALRESAPLENTVAPRSGAVERMEVGMSRFEAGIWALILYSIAMLHFLHIHEQLASIDREIVDLHRAARPTTPGTGDGE